MTLKFLSQRQWETVKAFAEVLFEGDSMPIGPADIANNVDDQLL